MDSGDPRYNGVKSPLKTALLNKIELWERKYTGFRVLLCRWVVFPATSALTVEDWSRFATAAHERIETILLEERSEKIGFYLKVPNPDAFQVYGREGESSDLLDEYSEGSSPDDRFLFDVSVCESVDDVERFEVILVMAR